jgi:hypothetical protein
MEKPLPLMMIRGISEGDADKDDPDGDKYELAGALHEFYHTFQVVSNLNDISAYPVATRRMRVKAKAKQPVATRRMRAKAKEKQQDEATKSEDTNPNDFLNDPNDITPSANDATEPAEAPALRYKLVGLSIVSNSKL